MRDAAVPPLDPVAVDRFRGALEALCAPFPHLTPDARLGLAVSGGPDSLAMLLLAHAACPGRIEAATVDHGLRAAAAAEAGTVAGICARLGVPHVTLRGDWRGSGPEGPQAAARNHRYHLLERWCGERDLSLLLTAHHADDQAETLLLRLSRGAGLGGLGAIRSARPLGTSVAAFQAGRPSPIILMRPLLRFAKAELIGIADAAGLPVANDPSNDDPRFDRTRARRLLAETPWLAADRMAASARHLAEAEAALCWATEREYRTRIELSVAKGGAGEWLLDPLGLPDEILRRIVLRLWSNIAATVAGDDGSEPPGPKLMRFIAGLRAGEKAMLGHVIAHPGPRWRFTIAPPRTRG